MKLCGIAHFGLRLAGVVIAAVGGVATVATAAAFVPAESPIFTATTGRGEQARPRPFDPELLRSGDIIRYRDLRRDDFLAAAPPAEAAGLHGRLGAATCVFLVTDPGTSIRASSSDQQRGLVRAQVENLGFLAFLDRECSWWNPAPVMLPDAYILQHEQIHFALFEIAARRLNSRAEELTRGMRAIAANQQDAVGEIERRIDLEMQRALEEVMARSNDFDRETSRAYRQDRQDWWWETISLELERLAANF
jgi:hypothetical protein